MKKNLPNFIIIGAMKAATTSIYTYLKQHPDIFMPKVKEPMFFNNYHQDNKYVVKGSNKKKITTLKQYKSLFDEVKAEGAIGEASPSYIYNEKAAELIKKEIPNVKIIVVLRQPVERAYSNFLHAKRAGKEAENDFEKTFDLEDERKIANWSPLYHYKSKGFYFEQLQRYFKVFPKENIKILLFEDIVKSPMESTQKLFSFLEVDANFKPDTSRKTNVSGKPKGMLGWILMKIRYYNLLPNIQLSKYLPQSAIRLLFKAVYEKPEKLDKHLKKKLTEKHFKSDILQLEKLIEKDLSHWL
ncbi:MAG: hypothetical protein CBC83_09545 [Flavobacteriales bacterium TMED123]|nr:MAG: hypothetical protein CBC83_09545 [Flavobacteriales bacterium TMED123]|tara:strand:- start:1058 stop:1954 length:897 start_codon:yes stop_codon:yes gene_type:complete